MRKPSHTKKNGITGKLILGLSLLLLSGAVISACDEPTPEPTAVPTVDVLAVADAAQATALAQTAIAQLTRTAIFGGTQDPTLLALTTTLAAATETSSPTATRRPTLDPTLLITQTPTTDFDAPNDILGNTLYDTQWLNGSLQTVEGDTVRLSDYLGTHVIVIHVLTTTCDPCREMQLNIRRIARTFRDEGRPYNMVYVSLNTNVSTPIEDLQIWAQELALLGFSSEGLTWLVGNASTDLLRGISQTFGAEALQPNAMSLIVVDKRLRSHLSREGLLSEERVRDIIVYYNDGLGLVTPEATENSQ